MHNFQFFSKETFDINHFWLC